ncbi:MAG: type 4a pilus biogenesis protein PilO [Candidatus Saccharibacteria bacterium]
MKSDKLNNFLGLCLLGAILMAVGTFFVVKPSLARSSTTSAKIKTTNVDIAGLHMLATQTDTLRTNYAEVKGRRDQILRQLPGKSEEDRLLALLSALGKQSGVVVSSFVPTGDGPVASSGAVASSIAAFPAAVSVTGTYLQQQSFLRLIENSARFIDLESASLGSGNSGSLAVSLVLQAYYQNDIAPVTSGGAK